MATAQKQQVITRVRVRNKTNTGRVKFLEKHDWSGCILGHFAEQILNNRMTKFLHQGIPPIAVNGSMGAMVYVGPNVQGDQHKCAWIFAWSVPGDGSPNKVYVDSGSITKFPDVTMKWDAIKTELRSSGHRSCHFDEDTAAKITADIEPNGDTPVLHVVLEVCR